MPTGTQPDPSPFAFEVAQRLRRAVRATDRPFAEIAADAGISSSQISRLLAGGRTLTIDQLMAIANVAGIDALALLAEARDAVSADAHSVTDAMDIADEVHGIDAGKKETYGLAAKRGRRKADIPHAE